MAFNLPDIKQKVVISNGFKKPLDDLKREIGRSKVHIVELRKEIERMGDTKSFKKLKKKMSSVRDGAAAIGDGFKQSARRTVLTVGAITASIGGLVSKTADYGDNVAKEAKKLNIGVEALQELSHAADLSGISNAKFTKGLEKFQRGAADAAKGLGRAKDSFRELGVQLKDNNGIIRPTEDLLNDVADAMQNAEDPTKRLGQLIELFGRDGARMHLVLAEGSKGIEKMRNQARQLGGIMSTEATAKAELFIDTLANVKQVIGGVAREMATIFMPHMIEFGESFQQFIHVNRPAINAFFQQLAVNIPKYIQRVVRFFRVMRDRLKPIFDFISDAINAIGWENSAMLAMATFLGGPFIKSLFNLIPMITNFVGAIKLAIPFIKSFWLVLAGGPVGWIILAVAALITLIIIFRKELSPIVDGFKQGLNPVLEEFGMMVDAVRDGLESMSVDFSGLKDLLAEFGAVWVRSVAWFVEMGVTISQLPLRLLFKQIKLIFWAFKFFNEVLEDVVNFIKSNFRPQIEWLGGKFDWLSDKAQKAIEKIEKLVKLAREAGKAIGIAPEGQTAQLSDDDLGPGTGKRRIGLSGRQLTEQVRRIGNPTETPLVKAVKRKVDSEKVDVRTLLEMTEGKAKKDKITFDFKNMPKGVKFDHEGDSDPDFGGLGPAFGG